MSPQLNRTNLHLMSPPGFQVFMIGAFPPPTDGRSLISSAVREKLIECSIPIQSIDLAAKSVRRTWSTRLGLSRIAKIAGGLIRYWAAARRHSDSALYIGLSGGPGQAFELLFTLIGRLTKARIYFHHHSFAYIDRPNILTRLLIWCAGRHATHIVLCPNMASSLKATYSTIEKLLVISNASLLPTDASRPNRERRLPDRLGFLGNISIEKGILEFLDVMQALCAGDLGITGYLAGPFQDTEAEKEVKKRLNDLPRVEYVGPKYGRDKTDFFNSIDVLLFPTKYAHEAEPLTVLEALAHGVPVIGWERGCLSSVLAGHEGLLVPKSSNFVPAAVRQVLAWRNAPQTYCQASKAAVDQFLRIGVRDARTLDELLRNLHAAKVR
jgi:glycosyltransferase involved in cell wall biosynthesis